MKAISQLFLVISLDQNNSLHCFSNYLMWRTGWFLFFFSMWEGPANEAFQSSWVGLSWPHHFFLFKYVLFQGHFETICTKPEDRMSFVLRLVIIDIKSLPSVPGTSTIFVLLLLTLHTGHACTVALLLQTYIQIWKSARNLRN